MRRVLFIVLGLLLPISLLAAEPNQVVKLNSVQIAVDKETNGSSNTVNVKIEIPSDITPNVFLLESPYRIVLDAPGIRIKKDEKVKVPGNKAVSQLRIGAHSDKLRVVVDVNTNNTPQFSWKRVNKDIVISIEEPTKAAPEILPTIVATNTPAITNTPISTSTPKPTKTPAPTKTATPTKSATPTKVATATKALPSSTPTKAVTATIAATHTPLNTVTPTLEPTVIAVATHTSTALPISSATKEATSPPISTATVVIVPTSTPTADATNTTVPTIQPSPTVIVTIKPTNSPTALPTNTKEATHTSTPKPTSTTAATATHTHAATNTHTPTHPPITSTPVPTAVATVAATATATAKVAATATPAILINPNARWILSEIKFDYLNPGKVPIIKLILSAPRARVQMTKINAETYKLILPETALLGNHLAKPQFPPSDFDGFDTLQAITTPDGIEITIHVQKGSTIGAFVRNNEVWMKKL